MSSSARVVVIGAGMVGHELARLLAEAGQASVTLVGDEPHWPYDRIHLGRVIEGAPAGELALAPVEGIERHLGDEAVAIDREARTVTTRAGAVLRYDHLVLATGSRPFVPIIPGIDGPGRHLYRTVDDAAAIAAEARRHGAGARAVVIGGGLLGLEAGGALLALGLAVDVIEIAPRLLPTQVDDAGGATLRRLVESKGLRVHTGVAVSRVEEEGGALAIHVADRVLAAEMLVVSAGIRPRDDLGRAAGLATGRRGGIAIDDQCVTSDPAISAIGECTSWREQGFGLVAPGHAMARVVAARLGGDTVARFTGSEPTTQLKLIGVDVASFGDAHGATEGCRSLAVLDGVRDAYKKIVVDATGKRLIGGVLVGDTGDLTRLAGILGIDDALPDPAAAVFAPAATTTAATPAMRICTCNDVTRGALCAAIAGGATDLPSLKKATRCGTGCGGCMPAVTDLLRGELAARGIAMSRHLCEHFPFSRQELVHLVKVRAIRDFDTLIEEHGRGLGCEICKPAVASILATTWNEHILDRDKVHLQDTNDRFLANLQRDGTYSVVPRVPGGEITPEQLLVIGRVAQRFDLYTKITGGQRIDLFGARVEQLPAIWRELVDAGFESGHAYGKAVRTVKTCVGSTWCRYGVQDSVGVGIRLEHRYKGLRAPHKLKLAVSGCTRECAEAQGKDVGVIATERGYNLYVCGNGGAQPRHADLLATDLDEPALFRMIDRFLMFYIRTADRLQRTARWLEGLEGGLDYLKGVVVDDRLGIAAELEAEMASLVGSYRCEWRATLEDPDKLARFRTYVNSKEQDDGLVYIRVRGQRQPA